MTSSSDNLPHIVTLEPGSAGLALGRSMIRAGARVTALTAPGHEWQGYSRGVRRLRAPFDPDGEPFVAALQRIAASGEETVVLPATDRACELLVRAADRLPDNLRMFEREAKGHLALMDKDQADAIARRAGVLVPWTATIRTEGELAVVAGDAPWPCVVKPVFSHDWRARYGEERVFVVADAQAAARTLERPLRDGVPMLLCQYIPGGDDHVEEAIVVRLADGSYPVRFGCRKLRQSPRGFGATALGESSPLPETMALAQRVLDEAGFVGVAGVEAKRHAETGERFFLEVNVRMPGQWGLGDACGTRASEQLVAALCGRALEPPPPLRPGVRFAVPNIDQTLLRELLRATPPRRRPAVAWGFLRSYAGAREVGILDPRDPITGLAWIASIVGRRLRRVLPA